MLSTIATIIKHRYCGVLAPNAKLRREVIERVLTHLGEPTAAPQVLPARGPPQSEIQFNQATGPDDWPDMDQTTGESDATWN